MLLAISAYAGLEWGCGFTRQIVIISILNIKHCKMMPALMQFLLMQSYWTKRKNTEKATKLYAQAIVSHDKNIRKLAHYNMANLYLHEAYLLLDASGLEVWDKVLPILSIAKESYREALRLAPDWMDAKYNYELALRLVPLSRQKSQ